MDVGEILQAFIDDSCGFPRMNAGRPLLQFAGIQGFGFP